MLQKFDFLRANRAALGPHGESDGDEEDHAEENQNAIEIERRVDKTGDKKSDRAKQKNSEAINEAAAHGVARFGSIEAAILAHRRRQLGAAIRTARHGCASFQMRRVKLVRASCASSTNSTTMPLPECTRGIIKSFLLASGSEDCDADELGPRTRLEIRS